MKSIIHYLPSTKSDASDFRVFATTEYFPSSSPSMSLISNLWTGPSSIILYFLFGTRALLSRYHMTGTSSLLSSHSNVAVPGSSPTSMSESLRMNSRGDSEKKLKLNRLRNLLKIIPQMYFR